MSFTNFTKKTGLKPAFELVRFQTSADGSLTILDASIPELSSLKNSWTSLQAASVAVAKLCAVLRPSKDQQNLVCELVA